MSQNMPEQQEKKQKSAVDALIESIGSGHSDAVVVPIYDPRTAAPTATQAHEELRRGEKIARETRERYKFDFSGAGIERGLPPTPGTPRAEQQAPARIEDQPSDSRIVPPTLVLDNETPEEAARRFKNLAASPPNEIDKVVALAVWMKKNKPPQLSLEEYAGQVMGRAKTDSAKAYIEYATSLAKDMPDDISWKSAPFMSSAIASHDKGYGPTSDYRIDLTIDPESGAPAIDLQKHYDNLYTQWFSAIAREKGYDSLDNISKADLLEIKREARKKTQSDLWSAAAAMRGVAFLDEGSAVEKATKDDFLPVAIWKAITSTHTTVSAYSPLASELEEEGTSAKAMRLGFFSTLDAAAPLIRYLRLNLGGAVTDEDFRIAAAMTLSDSDRVKLDSATIRTRLIRDFAHDYTMLEEARSIYGLTSKMLGKALGASDEEAEAAARDVMSSRAGLFGAMLPYFLPFDIDVATVGTLGVGKLLKLGIRAQKAAKLAKTISILESMHIEKYDDLLEALEKIRKVDPAAAQIFEARISNAINEGLELSGGIRDIERGEIGAEKAAETLEEKLEKIGDRKIYEVSDVERDAAKSVFGDLYDRVGELSAEEVRRVVEGVSEDISKAGVEHAARKKEFESYKESKAVQDGHKIYKRATKAGERVKARFQEIGDLIDTIPDKQAKEAATIYVKAREAYGRLQARAKFLRKQEDLIVRKGAPKGLDPVQLEDYYKANGLHQIRAELSDIVDEMRELRVDVKSSMEDLVEFLGEDLAKDFIGTANKKIGALNRARTEYGKLADMLRANRAYDPNVYAKLEKAAKDAEERYRQLVRAYNGWTKRGIRDGGEIFLRRLLSYEDDAIEFLRTDVSRGVKAFERLFKKVQQGTGAEVAAKVAEDLARDLAVGLDEIKKRDVGISYLGIPFIGVKRGLPPDQWSKIKRVIPRFTQIEKTDDGLKFVIDRDGYRKAIISEFGEDVVDAALKAAEEDLTRRMLDEKDIIQPLDEANAEAKKLTDEAKKYLEKGKEVPEDLREKIEKAEVEVDKLQKKKEAYERLQEGGKSEVDPDELLRALWAGEGDFILDPGQYEELADREIRFVMAARQTRENEDEFRLALAVLQSNHDVVIGGNKAVRFFNDVRLFVEGLWKSFDNVGKRIGNVGLPLRRVLETAESLADRYQGEMIEIANAAIKRGEPPEKAIAEYIDGTKPIGLRNGTTVLNTSHDTLWKRARHGILADQRSREASFKAAAGSQTEASLLEGGEVNMALLGLSRMWTAGVSEQVAGQLYGVAYRLLVKSETFEEFAQGMKRATFAIVGGDTTRIDTRTARVYALGARSVTHAAMLDDLSYFIAREGLGLVTESEMKSINKIFEGGEGLAGEIDTVSAVSKMLELGLSINTHTVRQDVAGALARSARGAAAHTQRLVEVTKRTTGPFTQESLFLPKVLQIEIDRNLGRIIKELDRYYARPASEAMRKLQAALGGLVHLWKVDSTTGLGVAEPAYFVKNFVGDWSQTWIEAGAFKATAIAASSFWSMIPFIGNKIQDYIGMQFHALKAKYGPEHPVISIIEALYSPHTGHFFAGNPDDVVELGGAKYTLKQLRERAIQDKILDTFIEEELQSAVKTRLDAFERRHRLYDPRMVVDKLQDLQNGINNFGVALQQRQRVTAWLYMLQRGKSFEEAREVVLRGLYDWKHGVAKDELLGIGKLFSFYRFFRLYIAQVSRAFTEPLTKPSWEYFKAALRKETGITRLRMQQMFIRDVVLGARKNDDPTLDPETRARLAYARALRPRWTRNMPAYVDLIDDDHRWRMRQVYGEDTPTATVTLLPPVIAFDGLEMFLTPFVGIVHLAMKAFGEDKAADDWMLQTAEPVISMLLPQNREAINMILAQIGADDTSMVTKSGEWKIRPEEYKVMSKIPFIGSFTRYDEEKDEFYATKAAVMAMRMMPILIGRMARMVKYWSYQNPHAGQSIGESLLYFARQMSYITGREYYYDPDRELKAMQRRGERAILRKEEKVRRRAYHEEPEVPNQYDLLPTME